MKLKERFKDANIFEMINTIHAFPFPETVFPMDKMNLFFVNQYGQKSLSSTGRETAMEDLATIISGMFSEKWDRVYETMSQDLPTLTSYTEHIKETKKDEGNTVNEASSTVANDLTAYNTEDFVNNDKSETTNKGTVTNKGTITREYERSGFNGDMSTQLESEIRLLQNNLIYYIIFSDIVSVTTLSIYE